MRGKMNYLMFWDKKRLKMFHKQNGLIMEECLLLNSTKKIDREKER